MVVARDRSVPSRRPPSRRRPGGSVAGGLRAPSMQLSRSQGPMPNARFPPIPIATASCPSTSHRHDRGQLARWRLARWRRPLRRREAARVGSPRITFGPASVCPHDGDRREVGGSMRERASARSTEPAGPDGLPGTAASGGAGAGQGRVCSTRAGMPVVPGGTFWSGGPVPPPGGCARSREGEAWSLRAPGASERAAGEGGSLPVGGHPAGVGRLASWRVEGGRVGGARWAVPATPGGRDGPEGAAQRRGRPSGGPGRRPCAPRRSDPGQARKGRRALGCRGASACRGRSIKTGRTVGGQQDNQSKQDTRV